MMDKILLAYPVQLELKIASQQFRQGLTSKPEKRVVLRSVRKAYIDAASTRREVSWTSRRV